MSRRPTVALALAGALACLAAACASTPTRFYTLDPVGPAASPLAAARVAPVRVDAVHLPPGLDRPEIATETGANRMEVHDFALWSAPLGEQARRVLTQDLAARLPAGAVVFPEAPKPVNGRGLSIDVLALTHADGQAVMDVSWTLSLGGVAPRGAGAGAQMPYAGRTLRLSVPASGAGAQAVPAELSALLGVLADRIAADLAPSR